jgi:hypothetical protein
VNAFLGIPGDIKDKKEKLRHKEGTQYKFYRENNLSP